MSETVTSRSHTAGKRNQGTSETL